MFGARRDFDFGYLLTSWLGSDHAHDGRRFDIIGYSLNDTIVIFDRIREDIPKYRNQSLYWVSNRAINDTLSRTILTYFTTYLTVISMLVFADGVIQEFALTMTIGMFLGAYSTIYVATPLMILTDKWYRYRKQQQLQAA